MGTTKKLFVYGASGHGKVVADIAENCGYEVAGFIDDGEKENAISFEKFLTLKKESCVVALGIGSNMARKRVFEKLKANSVRIVTLVHPKAVIAKSAKVGEGTVVMAGVVLNPDSLIERGAIINTASVIEHDNIIGEFAHISPGTTLAGDVSVGAFSHIGIGSSVIQGINIGSHATLGAGSVVLKDIPSSSTAYGVPAKVVKNEK